MFDVLIVGAGPAGSVAATVLARGGARVLVLDRARFPRDKLCGDTLNPGAIAVLRRLALDPIASAGLPVDGIIVTGESGVRVVGSYGTARGRALMRRELDASLVAAAAAAGARIEERATVTGAEVDRGTVLGVAMRGRDGRAVRVTAPIVIAADGRHSRVARALSLSRYARRPRRWAVGAYFMGVAAGEHARYGEMHVRAGYYIGVAPLPGGLTNACLVTTATPGLRDPSKLLRDALRAEPSLSERFDRARMIAPATSMGPLAVECTEPGAPGLLLAGDAAGFIDPMTGDGLRFAFRGGELAAEEALRVLERGWEDAHWRLARRRRREFRSKWRFNRALRALVSAPAAVSAAGFGAALMPGILQRAIAYAGDLHQQ